MSSQPISHDSAEEERPFEELAAEVAVTRILRYLGEDPGRDGLVDTPRRVVRAWREMTVGYREDPAEILSRTFDETSDELVILRGVTFYSTCEHHMLPFYGTVSLGIPAWESRGDQQARPSRSLLRQTVADSGEDDPADCRRHRAASRRAWRQGDRRGPPPLHGLSWSAASLHRDGYVINARNITQRSGQPVGVSSTGTQH